MSQKVTISIILPTYNGASYIARAIASVQAQTYIEWELIIVDDNSSDGTREIVHECRNTDSRIQYLKNEKNLGIQATLNRGMREAVGTYIARIDDDDFWCDQEKLQKQYDFLEKNEDYVLVGTGVILINEKSRELLRYLLPQTDTEIKNKILAKNCFAHSTVCFRKDVAIEYGGYSESADVKHVEDYDLWLKLGIKGKFANLPLYAVTLMMRNESLSAKNKINQFTKSLDLIRRYRSYYPHYITAYIRSIARILVYGLLVQTPLRSSLQKLMKAYKNYW